MVSVRDYYLKISFWHHILQLKICVCTGIPIKLPMILFAEKKKLPRSVEKITNNNAVKFEYIMLLNPCKSIFFVLSIYIQAYALANILDILSSIEKVLLWSQHLILVCVQSRITRLKRTHCIAPVIIDSPHRQIFPRRESPV